MATYYTYTTEKYGPLPHQHMLVGRPTGATLANAATDRWGYVYCPGGGWGLRDQLAITRDWGPRTSLMQGVFDHEESGGEPWEAATVFVLNVASESQNSLAISATSGDGDYATSAGGYFFDEVQPAAGPPYSVNDVVYGASQAYISLKDNNSDALGTAGSWETYEANACLVGRRPGGESSPGSLAQSTRDIQRAIAYIRSKSTDYNISSDKILLEGSSAGAQAAGCAAWGDPINYGHDSHVTASNPENAYADCRPNGLILSIAFCKLEDLATTNKQANQAGFLSFMNSLFGQSGLVSWSAWDALSDAQKRGVDPASAVLKSGYFVPTYFLYNGFTDSGMSNIWTRDEQANSVQASDYTAWTDLGGDYAAGDLVSVAGPGFFKCIQAHTPGDGTGGTVAEPSGTADTDYWAYTPAYGADSSTGAFEDMIHHSRNGREFMSLLGTSRASGGFGLDMSSAANSDVRLMMKDFSSLSGGTLNRGVSGQYNIYYGVPTNQQYRLDDTDKSKNREKVINTDSEVGNPDKNKLIADEVLGFFTSTRRNKYMD